MRISASVPSYLRVVPIEGNAPVAILASSPAEQNSDLVICQIGDHHIGKMIAVQTGEPGQTSRHQGSLTMWLLMTALLGFTIPNGFFLYWLFFEFDGVGPVIHDRLALGFILDVLLALILLSVYFARRPIGPVKWYWFVVLSFAGGLGFSLPLFYWLNQRQRPIA